MESLLFQESTEGGAGTPFALSQRVNMMYYWLEPSGIHVEETTVVLLPDYVDWNEFEIKGFSRLIWKWCFHSEHGDCILINWPTTSIRADRRYRQYDHSHACWSRIRCWNRETALKEISGAKFKKSRPRSYIHWTDEFVNCQSFLSLKQTPWGL